MKRVDTGKLYAQLMNIFQEDSENLFFFKEIKFNFLLLTNAPGLLFMKRKRGLPQYLSVVLDRSLSVLEITFVNENIIRTL